MNETEEMMKITIIGAGNVATHMTLGLADAGHTIPQVWSRTPAHAATLANRVGALPLSDLRSISPDADCYIFSVKDDVLAQVIGNMPDTAGIWVHTAGSLPMELFASRKADYGVLYPLQTFSRQRPLTFAEIPLFIEGSNPETTGIMEQLAATLSRTVYLMPGEKRKKLHLAAVFACNFVNHLYALSSGIIAEEDIPFEVLLPLISETAAKVREMAPAEGQTGPATRGDDDVMRKHLNLIKDTRTREIYRLLSESIAELTKSNPQLS